MGRYAKTDLYTPEENEFWSRFCACEARGFTTMRQLNYTFKVQGNEVFFDRKAKSVTRATIIQGYRKAKELNESDIPITTPKQLGVFGASYLLPILEYLGICHRQS